MTDNSPAVHCWGHDVFPSGQVRETDGWNRRNVSMLYSVVCYADLAMTGECYPSNKLLGYFHASASRTNSSYEHVARVIFDAMLIQQFEKLFLKSLLAVMLLLRVNVRNGPFHL